MFPTNQTANAVPTANPFDFSAFKAIGMTTYGDDLYTTPVDVPGFANLVPNGSSIAVDNGQYGLSLKLTSGAEVLYFPVHKSVGDASVVQNWKVVMFTASRDYKGVNVQNPDSAGRPVDITKYNQAVHGAVTSEINVVAGQQKAYAVAA